MNGYSVEIKETSKELTARERIKLKDTTGAIKIDEATADGNKLLITPIAYAVLSIHNDKSDNKDYNNYIVVDKDGQSYITGSESFWSSFQQIYDEMYGETEEWSITVYRLPSKNYKGKDFLTCSIN